MEGSANFTAHRKKKSKLKDCVFFYARLRCFSLDNRRVFCLNWLRISELDLCSSSQCCYSRSRYPRFCRPTNDNVVISETLLPEKYILGRFIQLVKRLDPRPCSVFPHRLSDSNCSCIPNTELSPYLIPFPVI